MTNAPPDLIVHIGPPKTATTTIQRQVFSVQSECSYLGKANPGILTTSNLYRKLKAYVREGKGEAAEIRRMLAKAICAADRPLLISDENITKGDFTPLGKRVQAQLERLEHVTRGTHVLIVVGVRNFHKAAFSAFVEFHHLYRQHQPPLDQMLAHGEMMSVYRYGNFRELLESLWPNRVFPLAFEDIVQGKVHLPGLTFEGTALSNARPAKLYKNHAIATKVKQRHFPNAAKILGRISLPIGRWLWNLAETEETLVPIWTAEDLESVQHIFEASERDRQQWLLEAKSWIWTQAGFHKTQDLV